MTSRPRKVGTEEESRIVLWFQEHGWPYAKRIAQKGRKDEGDVVLSERIPVVVESKAVKAWKPSTWIKELEEEVKNAEAKWGFLIIKRVRSTDVGEYYVLLPLKYLNPILKLLYGDTLKPYKRTNSRVIRRRSSVR